eukprot:801179-Prymnesium_polylepis.1
MTSFCMGRFSNQEVVDAVKRRAEQSCARGCGTALRARIRRRATTASSATPSVTSEAARETRQCLPRGVSSPLSPRGEARRNPLPRSANRQVQRARLLQHTLGRPPGAQ